MTTKMIAALAALILAAIPAQARTHIFNPQVAFDRHAAQVAEVVLHAPAVMKSWKKQKTRRGYRWKRLADHPALSQLAKKKTGKKQKRYDRDPGHGDVSLETEIVAHPVGCPRTSFCGCGASLEVFKRNIREAWLARWWFRFPLAEPAPGMVAVRRHHVFVIRKVIKPGLVLAYDANSGGHKTRIHLRRLAGFSVRNPRGGRYAALAAPPV